MNENYEFIMEMLSEERSKKNIMGVILFGSRAYNIETPNSDIDLIVVHKDCISSVVKKRIGDKEIDIHNIPLSAILAGISQEIDWLIGEIRDSIIIYDSHETIKSLKNLCFSFNFSSHSIEEDMRIAKESYASALDLLESGDYEGAYYCSQYAAEKCTRALLKKKNLFYKGPKYLISQISEVSDEYAKLFKTIILREIEDQELQRILQILYSLLEKVSYEEQIQPQEEDAWPSTASTP